MEIEILKQWQKDYPGVPGEVSGALAALLEKASDTREEIREILLPAANELMSELARRFAAAAELRTQVEEYEQARETVRQFREALSKELVERQVPEAFWQAAIETDTLSGEVLPSADAIQAAYKAYLQQQSDLKVDGQPRPQQAVQTQKVSPAVENYLRSRHSDSPLAGRLKG